MKPIRCFTCGKVLGNKWEIIEKLKSDGMKMSDIYEKLNISRYCCKKMVMTSYSNDNIIDYKTHENITIIKSNENNNVHFFKVS